MFFLSGKGCSEFPKRMLISIGILSKNEDLERRLQAAMNSVMDIEDVKKKEIMVQQIELMLKAAAI